MKKLCVQRIDTANYLRKAGIYCDGQKLGNTGFAELGEFEVPQGAKQAWVKMGRHQSEPFLLDGTVAKETLFLECTGSLKNRWVTPHKYLWLHRVAPHELPSQSELKAFKANFVKVAVISSFMLLLFSLFLVFTVYTAIVEQSPIWYLLTALAAFNLYTIGRGSRKRLLGQVE